MRQAAMKALEGVGDSALGEWEERGEKAYHVRRRLTPEEQVSIGVACDLRGLPEAEERLQRAWLWLKNWPVSLRTVAQHEVQTP